MKLAAFVRLLLVFAFLCTSCLVQPPDDDDASDDDDDDDASDDDDSSDDDDIPNLTGSFSGALLGTFTYEGEDTPCEGVGRMGLSPENIVGWGSLSCEVGNIDFEVDLAGLEIPGTAEVEGTRFGITYTVTLNIGIEAQNSTVIYVIWTADDISWGQELAFSISGTLLPDS